MAVSAIPVSSNMVLVVDYGIDQNGKAQTRERAHKGVKPAASNDDVYAVAQIFNSLQEKTLLSVQRRDVVELSAQ